MKATPPAAEPLLRVLRYGWRLPMLAWHVLVHLPITLLTIGLFDRRPAAHAAVRWWSRGLLRVFGMHVQRLGQPLAGGTMFVANHISWIDIVVLHSQHMMGFIAKSEIRDWPLVGWVTTHAETIFLQRGNSDSLNGVMDEMAQRLRDGRAVAVFPEGGTRNGEALGAFHARIFTAAVAADASVQPVALCYGDACQAQAVVAFAPGESFVGNFFRLLGEPPRPVKVHFLEPILHAEHAGRRALAHTARERVQAAMERS